MHNHPRLSALLLAAVFALLLLYPDTAAQGVRDALTLSAQVLAPSLLPFFVCSDLFVRLGLCARLSSRLRRPAAVLLRLPPAAAGALMLGLIGGYPAGAQAVGQLYARGELSQPEAERAAAICNQAGPSFLFGVLGGAVFHSTRLGLLLFAAQLLSVLLLCRLTGEKIPRCALPTRSFPAPPPFGAAFSASVKTAGRSFLHVCMFVTVFCVAGKFLLPVFGWFPAALQPLLLGVLELSGGCAALQTSSLPLLWQLVLASGLVCFGGLCVLAQSRAALGEYGLSGRFLLPYKMFQAIVSASVTFLLAFPFRNDFPVS